MFKKIIKIITILTALFVLAQIAQAQINIFQGGTATSTAADKGIYFYDGSTFSQDPSNLVWDHTNNRLGIGTSSPAYALDVVGSIRASSTFYGDTWSSYDGNSMNIKPSGDEDDFLSFKTVANRPTTKIEGGPFHFWESSSNVFTGLSMRKDDTHSGSIIYYKLEDRFGLSSKDPIVFKACEDYDDYVTICNATNIPELSVASSSGFKINAGGTNDLLLNHSGGNIGFGTSSTAYPFDFYGNTRIDGDLIVTGTGHDSFSDFVANEHLDWTQDLGATNIHSGNYTDTNTNANTICSGGTTYLDGEGNCDDISSVYETILTNSAGLLAALSDETGTGLAVFSTSPTFTTDITFPALCIEAGAYGADTIDGDDVNSNIAGRSLTLAAGSPNVLNADAELYTDTKCVYIEDPTAADDLKSLWRSPVAITITEIWSESDQTVTFNLQEDDGSPANIMNTSLAPAAGEASTSTFADAAFAANSRLDLVTDSVANTPTWFSICFKYTKND